MKKTFLIILICLFTAQFAEAQSKKLYVSRQGGEKNLMKLGKIGYNYYRFTNRSINCDSLICKGAGFEICKIDKDLVNLSKKEGNYYAIYNKAIRAAEKYSRKNKMSAGQFNLVIDNKSLTIKYSNADLKGNGDYEIIVL
jgi:hypothetical protein